MATNNTTQDAETKQNFQKEYENLPLSIPVKHFYVYPTIHHRICRWSALEVVKLFHKKISSLWKRNKPDVSSSPALSSISGFNWTSTNLNGLNLHNRQIRVRAYLEEKLWRLQPCCRNKGHKKTTKDTRRPQITTRHATSSRKVYGCCQLLHYMQRIMDHRRVSAYRCNDDRRMAEDRWEQ